MVKYLICYVKIFDMLCETYKIDANSHLLEYCSMSRNEM